MKIKDALRAIGPALTVVFMIWFMSYGLSKAVKDYEVVHPEKGISCIIVSRMFNTSVDCWKASD